LSIQGVSEGIFLYIQMFQVESVTLWYNVPYVTLYNISSWTVTEIITRETEVFLRFHVLYLFSTVCYPSTAQVCPWAGSQGKPCGGECDKKSTWKLKDGFYEAIARLACLINVTQMLIRY